MPFSKNSPIPLFHVLRAGRAALLCLAMGGPAIADFDSWTRSHGNAAANRFSGAEQVNRDNVHLLQAAWRYDAEHSWTIQANPIYAEGKLILATPGERVVAVDPATGKELWRYQGEAQAAMRGLVYWPGNGDVAARLYFPDGNHLVALELDGRPAAGFGENGKTGNHKSLVAPAIAGSVIVYPVYGDALVQGFDVISGELLWSTPLRLPLPDWPQSDPASYGGANPWGGISVDTERGIAFLATGNPLPTFVGITRPGDNRHANSVLAVDVRDGSILWTFQEIPHDIWDKDIPSTPLLTRIQRDGEWIDVVVAVTKHGNTLVLDRVTGKPVFPWRTREAPPSPLPGEQLASRQPDVQLPEPLSKAEFTRDDLTRLSDSAHAYALEVFEQSNSGFFPPFEPGRETLYFGLRGGAEWPGGAVDPASGVLYVASNDTPWRIKVINVAGLDALTLPDSPGRKLYLANCSACHGNALQGQGIFPALYGLEKVLRPRDIRRFVTKGERGMPPFGHLPEAEIDALIEYISGFRGAHDAEKIALEQDLPPRWHYTGWHLFADPQGYPANHPPWGWLNALDLNTGRMKWRVPLGSQPELEQPGQGDIGTENLAGATVTAGGLVFVAGTTDRLVRAFDSESGKELWRHELPFAGSAPPTVYSHAGRQYLLIGAGGGVLGTPVGNAFVAFALPEPDPDQPGTTQDHVRE